MKTAMTKTHADLVSNDFMGKLSDLPGFSKWSQKTKRKSSGKQDATNLLEKVSITRRIVITKISELFYPQGIWEPLKLQLNTSI